MEVRGQFKIGSISGMLEPSHLSFLGRLGAFIIISIVQCCLLCTEVLQNHDKASVRQSFIYRMFLIEYKTWITMSVCG